MKKDNLIIFSLLVFIFLCGCTNNHNDSKEVYIQKANEIIIQIIKESGCNCLLEIPTESLLEISIAENPNYDIRKFLISELKTQNNSNLDSLINLSKYFKIDLKTLQENNITLITLKDLKTVKKDNGKEILKRCEKGIICFRKPVFDKTFQKAVVDYNYAFTSLRTLPFSIYEFKNEKWKLIEIKN